jgi:hypothetical protein
MNGMYDVNQSELQSILQRGQLRKTAVPGRSHRTDNRLNGGERREVHIGLEARQ